MKNYLKDYSVIQVVVSLVSVRTLLDMAVAAGVVC